MAATTLELPAVTQATLRAPIKPPRGFNTHHCAVFAADARDFSLLNQVYAQGIGAAGITPGHGIVTGSAATGLP